MILCCPVCQSTEIYEVIGGYSGQIYRCKHCGYRGSLIIEVDEQDLREALLDRQEKNQEATKSLHSFHTDARYSMAMHEAGLYEKLPESAVKCSLCENRCTIREGKAGICSVRVNREGRCMRRPMDWLRRKQSIRSRKNPSSIFFPGPSAIHSGAWVAISIANTARTGIYRELRLGQ